jgi:peroxiredoxin
VSAECRAGDPLPHFTIRAIDGAEISYSRIWQRRHLLLICLPDEEPEEAAHYAAALTERQLEISACDAECLVTRDSVAGLPRPGVIVADRWGEVIFIAASTTVRELPTVDDLLEWLRHVQNRCPECEGEAR